MPTQTLGGASYFVMFIDDATRKVWAYATKSKDETFSCYKKLLSLVKTSSGRKLKILQLDNVGEYISKEFPDFYIAKGIQREFTTPYTPAQNGVAEWMNKTIQEQIMSMLSQANLTQGF